MPFLRNAWYVAAWDNELEAESLFARTLLGESVLFFRDDMGQVRAVSNRCPHRFAPLNMGTRIPNGVRCAYHGLEFNGLGECIHNPHGNGSIPKAAVLKSYKVIEKYSAIWIWMGDAAVANPELIPDFQFNDPEQYIVGKRYLRACANYVLETDNIMDLSHIQYLHPGTLGTGNVSQATIEIQQEGDTVWSKRLVHAELLPDFLYEANNIPRGTLVDRWIDVRWDAPANMVLYVGAVPAGKLVEPRVGRAITHHFTPETETTTHYWFANSYPKEMGEEGVKRAEAHIEGLNRPFTDEDLPMLEGQQRMMGSADFWTLKPILLPSDAAAVRARRILDRRIAQEQAALLPQEA